MRSVGHKLRSNFIARFLLVFFVSFVCASIMAGGTCFSATPIKIAMITAKTGDAGKSNAVSFDGARFAVKKINALGGILGQPVELLEYDNLSTPEGSAAAARKAISDGAVAVIGCNWSSHSLAMAKVMQKAHVPMISHMSTNEAVTRVGDYIFRACFTDSFQGKGLARFSRNQLKDRTAVILVDESRAYSKGLAETFARAFKKHGGQILWQGMYTSDSIPYDTLLDKVADLAPDALFVPGGYADVAGFFGRARDMNAKWHLLSADGVGIRLYEFMGNKAHGIYYSGHWSRWVNSELSRKFVREYEAENGHVNVDTLALVYDSFMVLREAIERAGSVDGEKIRDALAATPGYEGVTGTIRFDENGDPIKPMVINEFKFGGVLYLDQIHP